ncbi:MAG TPA: PspC domain-containing protein [Acidimicrobiales bacterium]|nr:PspC domain-containing protein [Acidimicrobiales bacterium]
MAAGSGPGYRGRPWTSPDPFGGRVRQIQGASALTSSHRAWDYGSTPTSPTAPTSAYPQAPSGSSARRGAPFAAPPGPGPAPSNGAFSRSPARGWLQLQRPTQGRLLGGVAAALAVKLDINPLAARIAFAVLTFVGGAGLALYVLVWLCLPAEANGHSIARLALADGKTVGLVAAVASGLVAAMVAVAALGSSPVVDALSPGLVSLAGLVAVWRHAAPEDREAANRFALLVSGSGPSATPANRRALFAAARLLAGAGLIALGTSTLLAPKHLNGADLAVAFAAIGVVAGVSLILAPWWLRLGRELSAERRQRARAEERAEMAAHLHDSVLQTLALIQRSAGDPQQVQRLARAQERELRSWLFDQGREQKVEAVGLAAALNAVQQDVEDDHGLRVDLVTVGDAPLDEDLAALVAATREAVVNAAKWSGADVVFVYAEVEPDEISVFVRDKGKGFDPSAVAGDRKGLSESVHARMHRHGGAAAVRSGPGEGTEVRLTMPKRPAA